MTKRGPYKRSRYRWLCACGAHAWGVLTQGFPLYDAGAATGISRCQNGEPAHEAQDESYNAADDFSRSIDACYRAVRERVAAGGKGWPR
jgi:hypothetical protein